MCPHAAAGARMTTRSGFVAYPNRPSAVGHTIEDALTQVQQRTGPGLRSWRETDIAGQFVAAAVLGEIGQSEYFVADVSQLNFNVAYEVGFAIGLGKKMLLIRNPSVLQQPPTVQEVGIFDTLGHMTYENAAQLASILFNIVFSSLIRRPP